METLKPPRFSGECLELSPTKPEFIEPTAMHSIALIGSGHSERGLRQGRQMFARIRDSQSSSDQAKMEMVEHIDEAIEVYGPVHDDAWYFSFRHELAWS